MRIAKAISEAGICSRRDAEKLILQGRVSINGTLLESPAINVTDNDLITIDGKELPKKNPLRIWLYYKPTGVITTHKDPQNRPTVFSLLPKNMPKVISVGRLDIMSEGLLILTNSGEYSRRLELPSSNIKRVYHVHCYGVLDFDLLSKTTQGITIKKEYFKPTRIEIISTKNNNHIIEIELTEGKNREIRKIFANFDLKIKKLLRIQYGDFKLGNLKPGEILEIAC
ncbi:MAG: hypothetical protein RLZZ59_121 [Pseudomonadota bacterium]|jgi:23S rRNA pseudouridine2605 synthase